jgi:murein DD-endopeptidase MepM/ murein hydrolase activator NlpD
MELPKEVSPLRRITERLNSRLERVLPEKRLFLKSDSGTRFVRLRPLSQAVILSAGSALMVWTIVVSAIVFMESIGSVNLREQSRRDLATFEQRLNALSAERDRRAEEAEAAQARYMLAMERVAEMQTALIATEQRRAELETGIDVVQRTLRERVRERDHARARLAAIEAGDATDAARLTAGLHDAEMTLDFVTAALRDSAAEREMLAALADQAAQQAQHLALEYRLIQDRNDRIFRQLEQAVEVSVLPLERMFRSAGINPQSVLNAVRQGYQQRSAALMPLTVSTSGTLLPDSDEARANSVILALEEINAYRIAAARAPFAMPVRSGAVRHTSGYGMRRDPRTGASRMHSGIDWAGPQGTAIHVTSDGVVTRAGRDGAYGNLVVVQHDFGIETYYAHLHSINVNVGQRVSRGDRIGGMGTTGRSTGVHLHYEIRVNGRPVNPMTYIRAAQDVF